MSGALQPVPPLLKGQFDGQELLVPHVVISGNQAAGEEGTGMELVFRGRALGQGGSNAHVRGVYLYHELKGGVRVGEDRGGGEPGLEEGEAWRPGKRDQRGGEAGERGGQGTVTTDKAMVEIGKAQKALQLFNGSGGGPVDHSLDFGCICTEPPTLNNETQKLYGWDMKLAFFCFNKQFMAKQSLQNSTDM